MPEQAAQNLEETECLIARQIVRIKKLEAAGCFAQARIARETLAAITETRDALRLRLTIARQVVATERRWLWKA